MERGTGYVCCVASLGCCCGGGCCYCFLPHFLSAVATVPPSGNSEIVSKDTETLASGFRVHDWSEVSVRYSRVVALPVTYRAHIDPSQYGTGTSDKVKELWLTPAQIPKV